MPAPAPGPGEVGVDLSAAGVNFPDLLMSRGKYQLRPPLPFVPGMEGAGVVRAVGPGVAAFAPGDRVIARMQLGAFAERCVVPSSHVAPLPQRFDMVTGAGFSVAAATAYTALVRRGRLEAGEWLVIHGASGGVGLAAVQVAKRLGARVIATGSDDRKLAVVRDHGADHLVNLRAEDWRARVLELTGGAGADVIYDPVGGETFETSLRALAWGGRLLVIGFAGGRIGTVKTNLPLLKSSEVVGVRSGEFGRRHPDLAGEDFRRLLAWAEEGALTPRISHTLPLAEAGKALQLLDERRVLGKVVLLIGENSSPLTGASPVA